MIELTQMTCGECGCVFGLNTRHYDSMRDEKGSFKCPNGHSRQFNNETEAEKSARYYRWFNEAVIERNKLTTQNRRLKTQVKNLKAKAKA